MTRLTLRRAGVRMLGGVEYVRIDDAGLHVRTHGAVQVLPVDHVVICAGQDPVRSLGAHPHGAVTGRARHHLVGGAADATGLDAVRAISEGTRLGASL